MDNSLEFYKSMAQIGIHNYVVPGVSSFLVQEWAYLESGPWEGEE